MKLVEYRYLQRTLNPHYVMVGQHGAAEMAPQPPPVLQIKENFIVGPISMHGFTEYELIEVKDPEWVDVPIVHVG